MKLLKQYPLRFFIVGLLGGVGLGVWPKKTGWEKIGVGACIAYSPG